MTVEEPVFVLRTNRDGPGDAAEGFTGRDGRTPGVDSSVSGAGSRGTDTKHTKRLSRQQSRSPRNRSLKLLASAGSSSAASISSASPSLAHSTTLTIGPPSPGVSSASPSRGKNYPRATLGGGFGGRNSPSAGRPRPFSAHAAPGSSPKPPLSPSVAASGDSPPGEWELMWRDALTRTGASARGLVAPLQRGVEEAPARIQRGVVDGAVAIGGAANAVKVRAQAMAGAALGLLDRLDGDRLHCPRCKGSGLLSPAHAWSRLLRPPPSATNEPCWFCQGIGVMPIFDLSGFLVARCPPLVSPRHGSSATASSLRFSSFQLFLGKFPGTRTRLITSRLPRMLRHAIFTPALGPFCNPTQDEAVRAFCSREDPSAPPSSASSSSSSSESPAARTAAAAAATAAAAAAGASPAGAGSAVSPLGSAPSLHDSQDLSPKASPRHGKWQQQRQQEQQSRAGQQAQEQQREQRRQQREGEGRGGGGCSGGRSRGRRGGSAGRLGSSQTSPQPIPANSSSNSNSSNNSGSSGSGTITPASGDQTARFRSSAANSPSGETSSLWDQLSSPVRSATPGTALPPGSPHTSTTSATSPAGTLQSGAAGGGAGDGAGVDEETAEGVGEVWVGVGEFGQQSPRSRSPRRERNKVREKAERQAVERARVLQRTSSGRGGRGGINEAAEALEADSQGGANDLWWIVGARIRAAGSSFAPSMDFPSSHSATFSLVPSSPRTKQPSNPDSKKPS
ncbi:hypothetical protein CLOM_g12561 [Closterium sp. NIES-68]|nr:hypothetical protein CLOM_g12561 [Closterium sp. NIES-68]